MTNSYVKKFVKRENKYSFVIILNILVLYCFLNFNLKLISVNRNLIHKKYSLQEEIAKLEIVLNSDGDPIIGKNFPLFELKSLSNKIYSEKNLSGIYILFIFFSPYDCGECLLESNYWEEIHKNYSNNFFKVFAIANAPRKREITLFVKRRKLTFPILYDKDNKIKKALGIRRTPIKILLNQDNQIIFAQYSTNNTENNKKLTDRIVLISR